jgi:hypothetical protein
VAEEASGAGWLGVGTFGPHLATTVDAGVDVAGESYAVGVGARLRYLAGEGFRGEDWDDASEILGLLRYALYRRAGDDGDDDRRLQVAAAAGELGGVVLGHGTVVDGYATGLDVDHRRVGAQARVDGGPFGFEALVDDVTAPRVVATRAQWVHRERLRFGFSAVGDLSAPGDASSPEPTATGGSREILPILAADAEYLLESRDGSVTGRGYADVVSVVGLASGAHLGGAGSAVVGRARTRVSARGELRLGSDGYFPGWVGPLYDLTRARRLAEARAGGMAGLGILGEVGVEVPRAGDGRVSYASRPGTSDLVTARVAMPHFRGVQGALWGALEVGGDGNAPAVMALEVRALVRPKMFVVVEAAHLYRTSAEGAQVPIWIATTALGGVIGE